MEPVIDDASMVPSDSSLGYGPTTRGPTQGLAGNFGGVVRTWIWKIGALRATGGRRGTLLLLVVKGGAQVHVPS